MKASVTEFDRLALDNNNYPLVRVGDAREATITNLTAGGSIALQPGTKFVRIATDTALTVDVGGGVTQFMPANTVDLFHVVKGGTVVIAPIGAGQVPSTAQGIKPGNPTYFGFKLEDTSYATPTDMYSLVNPAGSGKVIIVRSFTMGMQSTTATLVKIRWFKRAALNTGGTYTAPGIIKYDSNDAAPVGVFKAWTSAPTINDNPGPIGYQQISTSALTGGPFVTNMTSTIGGTTATNSVDLAEPITLRPGEEMAINFNGVALPGGAVFSPAAVWAEN